MKLVALKYGTTYLSESVAFVGGDPEKNMMIDLTFYLIEWGERKILIDVGSDDMPKFVLQKFQKPISVLKKYGLTPEEITDVYLTHAHYDHIGAIGYYKNALIHINEQELEYASKRMPEGMKVTTFSNCESISEEITVKHIGGHTNGSCVVLVEANSTTYVLCGDECYFDKNIVEMIPTATTKSMDNSINFIKEYSKTKYTPLCFHQPGIVEDIGYKIIYEDKAI